MRNFIYSFAVGGALLLGACRQDPPDNGATVPPPPPVGTPTPPPPPPVPNPDVSIAFIGSAVINGTGASSENTSWTTLIADFFESEFGVVDSRVFGANRTNSEFGAYRIDQDLQRANFVPDYVFISFTNDDSDPLSIKTFQDAIIYKLRQVNPNVVVILVAVARDNDEADRRANREPARVTPIRELADAEGDGVFFVDVGDALFDEVISGRATLSSLLVEGFPTDRGYAVYADAVIDFLEPRLPIMAQRQSTSAYIADTKLQNARLVDTENSTNNCSAFTLPEEVYLRRGMQCNAGEEFTLSFSGTTFGITRATISSGGTLNCSVDNGTPVSISFYEPNIQTFALRPIRVFENLDNVSHNVRCTVSAQSPAGSDGTDVTIGSFFVSSGRLLTRP